MRHQEVHGLIARGKDTTKVHHALHAIIPGDLGEHDAEVDIVDIVDGHELVGDWCLEHARALVKELKVLREEACHSVLLIVVMFVMVAEGALRELLVREAQRLGEVACAVLAHHVHVVGKKSHATPFG